MRCYRNEDGLRYVRQRHDDEWCPEANWCPPFAWIDCAGCQRCTEPHCRVMRRDDKRDCQVHAESVCPSCLSWARDDLAEVVRLSGLPLLEEALTKGVRSEAADLLGSVANPHAWRQRGRFGHRYEPDSRLGEQHPLWVLGRFDLLITEHLGHTRTAGISIGTAAGYIGRNLHFLAADIEFDFADLASDLRDCRAHLEAVLHDGEQVERVAPCVRCGRQLVRSTDNHGTTYRCERCRTDLTDNQYRLAVRAAHVAHADRLSVPDLADRLDVPESTLRRWANVVRVQREGEEPIEHPPLLRPCGRDSRGRNVYRVEEAERVKAAGDTRRSGIVSVEGVA